MEHDAPDDQSMILSSPDGGATGTRRVLTWGERLAQEAHRLAQRRMPTLPWMFSLGPVIERVSTLPTPANERFQRIDAPATRQGMHLEKQTEGLDNSRTQLLAPDVRSRLHDLMGTNLPEIRIHDDPPADSLARAHRADAVTIGRDVYFRKSRFQPHEETGLALLAHEATHVIQAMRPNADWRRATQAGVKEQEREASAGEQAVLAVQRHLQPDLQLRPGRWERLGPRLPEHVPLQQPASPESPSPALRPMMAMSDRGTLELPQTAGPDIEGLRQALYHDLMSQIKTDFERGG